MSETPMKPETIEFWAENYTSWRDIAHRGDYPPSADPLIEDDVRLIRDTLREWLEAKDINIDRWDDGKYYYVSPAKYRGYKVSKTYSTYDEAMLAAVKAVKGGE